MTTYLRAKKMFGLTACLFTITVSTPISAQFTTVINLPPDADPGVIGSDTQLNLISGGRIGSGFAAGSPDGSSAGLEVNITGGFVGNNFTAYAGSTVNISGGDVEHNFDAMDGSVINISGGSIRGLNAQAGGTVNITGGFFAHDYFSGIELNTGSTVNIAGGRFASGLSRAQGASLSFTGNDFRLNGVPVSGPTDIPYGTSLTGILADGSVFAFSGYDLNNEMVLLNTVDLPPLGSGVVNAPQEPVPNGLRPGLTLNVGPGADLGKYFRVVEGTLNINGGRSGERLTVNSSTLNITADSLIKGFSAFNGSTATISGGNISDFSYLTDSTLSMSGGTIGSLSARNSVVDFTGGHLRSSLTLKSGSVATVSDGMIRSVTVGDGAEFTLNDGLITNVIRVSDGGVAHITGGGIADYYEIGDGGTLTVSGGMFGDSIITDAGSSVELIGGEFLLNGQPVSGPVDVPAGSMLSATLSDGSVFITEGGTRNPRIAPGTLTLTQTTLPDPGPSTINAPGDTVPRGLRAGQTLNIGNGAVVPPNFATIDAALNIHGGRVGDRLRTINTDVHLTDGTIGSETSFLAQSDVTITGGTIEGTTYIIDSSLNMSGGKAYEVRLESGKAEIHGDAEIDEFNINTGMSATISGQAEIGKLVVSGNASVDLRGGGFDRFNVSSEAQVTLHGGEFLTYLGFPASRDSYVSNDHRILTATLEDGTVAFIMGNGGYATNGGSMTVSLNKTTIPDLGPLIINAPADPAPLGLRPGQTLNLGAGAELGKYFGAVDATLNITGGRIDEGLRFIRTDVTLNDGELGAGVIALDGSSMSINGGSLKGNLLFPSDGTLTIAGGDVAGLVEIRDRSVAHITGGHIDRLLLDGISGTVSGDAVIGSLSGNIIVHVSGGTIERGAWGRLTVSGGTIGGFMGGGGTKLEGGEFVSDIRYSFRKGLDYGSIVTGTLSDGTVFIHGAENWGKSIREGDRLYVYDEIIGPHRSILFIETSVPPVTQYVMDTRTDPIPKGLRAGQTLHVRDGADVPAYFAAVDATLNINGGTVGDELESARSNINITGGTVGDNFRVYGGSVVTLSGGTIGEQFYALQESTVIIEGVAFYLNGQDITGRFLYDPTQLILDRDVELSGLLADGTPFSFGLTDRFSERWVRSSRADYFDRDAILKLTLVPEPATLTLLGFGSFCLLRRRAP